MDSKKKAEVNELLKNIHDGDSKALESLIKLKTNDLLMLANSYLKNNMLSEDIVSETFITLIKNIHKIKNYKNLNGWLNTIVIHKCLDLIKKSKWEIAVENDFIILRSSESTDLCEKIHIRNCFESLIENEQKALLLHYHGFTLSEIAKTMNLTMNKVRRFIKRGRKNFNRYYEIN